MAEEAGFLDDVESWWRCTPDDVPVRPAQHDLNFRPAGAFEAEKGAPGVVGLGVGAGGAAAAALAGVAAGAGKVAAGVDKVAKRVGSGGKLLGTVMRGLGNGGGIARGFL